MILGSACTSWQDTQRSPTRAAAGHRAEAVAALQRCAVEKTREVHLRSREEDTGCPYFDLQVPQRNPLCAFTV